MIMKCHEDFVEVDACLTLLGVIHLDCQMAIGIIYMNTFMSTWIDVCQFQKRTCNLKLQISDTSSKAVFSNSSASD